MSALRAFAAKVGVPVAAGERNTTIWEFAEYLERPGVAFVRPDVGIAGGITHVKKICALAEAFHAGVLPHAVPSGPVAVAAHVQLGMCVPNWELQEHLPQDQPRWTDLVDQVIEVRDGYLLPPDRPGLGIEPRRRRPRTASADVAPTSRTRRCARTALWRSDERRGEPPRKRCRSRLQRGLRRRYIDDADLARLRSASPTSPIEPSAWTAAASGPVPRDREAEAELARFAADLDVLVVCHGAPFVSADVLAARPAAHPARRA